jgi:uncharacterized protein (TIGR01244 family)
VPVQSAYQTPEQVAEFARVMEELPRPVLLYCRSGSRSARLYQQAQAL